VYSATSSEKYGESNETLNEKEQRPRISKAFSSPKADVFLKTSDGVVFCVEELYLKASR
jgi:hypothetical protein